MNIEKIFREISEFAKLTLDVVLFESKYPILFTCKNGSEIYLFICCLVRADWMKWIGTKTDYPTLIRLLENRITIKGAFLEVTDQKIIIEYNGIMANCRKLRAQDIPDDLLPSEGEFMDAQEDEFAEEIAVFKLRNENMEYDIPPLVNKIYLFDCAKRSVLIPDTYFDLNFEAVDMVAYTIEKIQGQTAVLCSKERL